MRASVWYMHSVRKVRSHLMNAATKGMCGTTPTLLLAWILRHVKLCEGLSHKSFALVYHQDPPSLHPGGEHSNGGHGRYGRDQPHV